MDDDNGLELSLGLSCGGSSGKGKGNINNGENSSDNHKTEGNDRSAKVIDDFKNFLQQTNQRSEQQQSSQRSDSQQNFFNDLSKASSNDAETSIKPLWIDEETRKETGNKRKFGFPAINGENNEKEKKADQNLHEKKTKASHISTATDEGSTADNNEDVAESEVGGSSNLGNEIRPPPTDKTIPDLSKNRGNSSTEEFTNRNMSYTNVPFKLQAKETGHGTPSILQPTGNSVNLPVMFGYSPVQLPMLDKDGSGGIIALSQSPFAGRAASNTAAPKGEGKQPAAEEGSSEDARCPTDVSDRITADNNNNNNNNNTAFSFDFSAIKPGIGADVKFGGSGACPNLPWVSTTGSGPHGRTISGVTYRYNANQIKIVCACHGLHMSPEEFVRHASEEFVSSDSSIGLTAASAHT